MPTVSWGRFATTLGCTGSAAVLALVFVFGSGCESQETITVPSSEGTNSAGLDCEGLLDSILNMVQPDRLEVSSAAKDAADVLNEWISECGSAGARSAESDAATSRLAGELLSDEQLAGLDELRFGTRDAEHLRTAILLKQMAEFAVETPEDDVERATQLFQYVVRNVALAESEAAMPLSPYDVLLFGRGSAADRAWIFAELLRQLRIDAVIVRPLNSESGDGGSADGRWLVGVLLDGETYLYDPRLGWPIPAADAPGATPLVERPATLADAASNSEILDQLKVNDERGYPLAADDLKQVRVELIGHEPYWSTRMRQLQMSLAGARSVIVYDGLGDSAAGRGLSARVAAAGKDFWGEEDLSIWPHPQQSMNGHAALEDAQDQQLLIRRFAFNAPAPVGVDPGTQELRIGRPERLQLETRIAQLEGRLEDAVKSYQMIRISANFNPQLPIPAELRLMHAQAGDDAMYWVGLIQYELGDYGAAAETFASYLLTQPRGQWQQESARMRALCLAERGELDSAVKIMTALSIRYPERAEYELLSRRWRAARDAAEKSPEAADAK